MNRGDPGLVVALIVGIVAILAVLLFAPNLKAAPAVGAPGYVCQACIEFQASAESSTGVRTIVRCCDAVQEKINRPPAIAAPARASQRRSDRPPPPD